MGDARVGTLPVEVKNLLYAVKIKVLAARAGIESISTEDGQIILRRFQGLPFNQQKLEPLKDGIKVGTTRLTLNPKRLGGGWKIDRNPKVLLGWSQFFEREFIQGTGISEDADLFYLQYAFKF